MGGRDRVIGHSGGDHAGSSSPSGSCSALALAPLQPKLQTIASDESETFFTRGADSTEVDRLLDTRFPEGGDATAVIAFVATEGSIYERTPDDRAVRRAHLRERGAAGAEGRRRARTASCAARSGHVLAPETPPSPFSSDTPGDDGALTVVNGRDDTESVAADVAAMREIAAGAGRSPGGAAT